MSITRLAIGLYVCASVIAVFAIVFDFNNLELLVKPIILPAILFCYLNENTKQNNVLFCFLIIINFCSDMTALCLFSGTNDIIVGLNFISNICITVLFIRDFFELRKFENKYFIQFIVILVGFLSLVYFLISLITDFNFEKKAFYFLYGIVLSILITFSIQNYLILNTKRSYFALLLGMGFLITDSFFIIYNFYIPMKVFLVIHHAVQFGSYYFLYKYFQTSKNKGIKNV